MKHNLKKMEIDGGTWSQCSDCGCTIFNSYWWVNGKKSKTEPECSADNLDWERRAEDGGVTWS